ncbi:MAG: transposase, partial [Desulfobulbaceae bacterium]|nr:transposase [Desulfobulbaceae bacterium]
RGQWNSITYPQYSKPLGSIIQIPKVGMVKMVYHRTVSTSAKIKTLTITKEGGKWFACFSFEYSLEIEPKQDLLPSIGIDLGLKDFIYTSDGVSVPVPKYLRAKEKQLKRLQRRLSKATKRSKKYYKILLAIQKCHYRIRCRRSDFLHKTANNLFATCDALFHEDLKIKNMIRKPKPKQDEDGTYIPNGASAKAGLNKSIADAGWGQFLCLLKYKAVETGKTLLAVPPHYTSQICSACGNMVKKSLSVRTHRCGCGFVANRDHNAALNILRIGMDTLQT